MPLLMKIGKGLYHAYKDHHPSSTENQDGQYAYPSRQDYPQRPASSYHDGPPPPYGYSDNEIESRPGRSSCENTLSPPQLRDRPHSQPPPMHRPQQYPQPEGHPERARLEQPHVQPAMQPSQFQTQAPHFNPEARQHYNAQGFPQARPQEYPHGLRPPHAQPYRPQPYQEGPYAAYGAQVPYSTRYSDEYIDNDYDDGYDEGYDSRRGRRGGRKGGMDGRGHRGRGGLVSMLLR